MTDELIVSAANGAGGTFANIFSHKIEKIHSYFLEKDLQNEITPDQISKTLNTYLEKLSKRVSEITTIAFPQHKLELNKIYEPLKVVEINKNIYQPLDLQYETNKGAPFDIIESLKKITIHI